MSTVRIFNIIYDTRTGQPFANRGTMDCRSVSVTKANELRRFAEDSGIQVDDFGNAFYFFPALIVDELDLVEVQNASR